MFEYSTDLHMVSLSTAGVFKVRATRACQGRRTKW